MPVLLPRFQPPSVDPTLATLVDTNPDLKIVEVSLSAEPARLPLIAGRPPIDVWAYRDASVPGSLPSIPGPMLEANVGDRVIVHFTNKLPAATTVHWHGLQVPFAADGTPTSQQPVAPGASSTYDFVVEDAATYWYHPHVDSEQQIERGLYGPIRIRGGVTPDVAADRVFVLDDVKLGADGQLSTATDIHDVMFGRQGNVLLVNGRAHAELEAAADSRERWRFVNAANGRYFNLDLPGHTFRVIGWDGGELVEPYQTESLLVAPGERYDVLVELTGADGDDLTLRNVYYDRGHGVPKSDPATLVAIHLGAAGDPAAPLPAQWATIAPVPIDPLTPRRAIVLGEHAEADKATFSINGEMSGHGTPIAVHSGDVEIWEVKNATEMDHPFHVHGNRFQVLGDAHMGWKDTVNVPKNQTVRLAMRFGLPGSWMFHCHILEHIDRGMMGDLEVLPPAIVAVGGSREIPAIPATPPASPAIPLTPPNLANNAPPTGDPPREIPAIPVAPSETPPVIRDR